MAEARALFRQVLLAEADTLRDFADSVPAEDLAQVVRLLEECTGKIVCSGVGKSGAIARKLAGTFASTGSPAIFLHPVEAMHGDLGVLRPGDLVFALTKGGESEELLRMLRAVKEMRLPIVAIVGPSDSSTARLADAIVAMGNIIEADPLGLAPTSSTTLTVAIGDALALILSNRRGFKPEQFAGFHPGGQLGRRLNYKVGDLLPPDRGVPTIGPEADMRSLLEEESRLNLGAIIIVDEERRVLGIVTDGDVRRAILRHGDILGRSVSDVMTRNPVTVRLESLATEALALMENRPSQIHVLPVLDEQRRVVALLRLHDVVRAGL